MISKPMTTLLALSLMVTGASAETISFNSSWKEQGFLSLFSNDYALNGSSLGVKSDETVSMLYRAAPKSVQGATKASWNWKVTKSVKPTNLLKKGGDDRNLSIYFVFADKKTADSLKSLSARKLLGNPAVKSRSYIWGGNYPVGKSYDSPYRPGALAMVMKRKAGTGSHSETVNLASDFKRAFGKAPEALIGIAVTGDSDDTDGQIDAVISNLKVF